MSRASMHAEYRPGPFPHPVLGDYHLYSWCGRCQRVNLTSRWARNEWRCPCPDCDGVADDAWRWEEVRAVEPGFPNHPLLTRLYKLYAFDAEIQAFTEGIDAGQSALAEAST